MILEFDVLCGEKCSMKGTQLLVFVRKVESCLVTFNRCVRPVARGSRNVIFDVYLTN